MDLTRSRYVRHQCAGRGGVGGIVRQIFWRFPELFGALLGLIRAVWSILVVVVELGTS